MTSFSFNLNPNLRQEIKEAYEKKIQSILDLRCDRHSIGPKLTEVDSKPAFDTCCEDFEKRVREAMESRD